MPPLQQTQQQSPANNNSSPRWATILLVIFALTGFADATYLTIDHYQNIAPPCFVGSCEVVLTSAYSTVAGIPVSIFGVVYYLFVLIALFVFINGGTDAVTGLKKMRAFRIALYATPLGFLASLYFFTIQAFVLHHFCQYCLLSASTSTVLFIIAIYLWAKGRKFKF